MPTLKESTSKTWAGAVLIPLVVQSIILVLDRNGALQEMTRLKDAPPFALATVAVSTLTGFAVLFPRFGKRALIIAIAYVPIMGIVVFLFSFAFGALVLRQAP